MTKKVAAAIVSVEAVSADVAPSRKARKPRKPDGQKKPLGAFFLFSKDNRETVKKEHPTLSVTEVAKKMGEMWREVSEADKKKYNTAAETAMKKFNDAKPPKE